MRILTSYMTKKKLPNFINKFVNAENIEHADFSYSMRSYASMKSFFDIIKNVPFTELFSNMKLSVFLNLLPFIMKLIEVDFTYASSDISVVVTFLYI